MGEKKRCLKKLSKEQKRYLFSKVDEYSKTVSRDNAFLTAIHEMVVRAREDRDYIVKEIKKQLGIKPQEGIVEPNRNEEDYVEPRKIISKELGDLLLAREKSRKK